MNKRPFEEMDDPPLEEVASGSERYTEDQKVLYFILKGNNASNNVSSI